MINPNEDRPYPGIEPETTNFPETNLISIILREESLLISHIKSDKDCFGRLP
jgi:hypothetical protein